MVYAIKDGNGRTAYTSDPQEALFNRVNSSSQHFDNSLEAFFSHAGRSLVDTLSGRRAIALDRAAEKSKTYADVHQTALVVLNLIATPDGDKSLHEIDLATAIEVFLKFSGLLSAGISNEVVLDNEPTKKLQETLDSSVGILLGIPEGTGSPSENFNFDLILSQINPATLEVACVSVLADLKAWIASDSMVQTLRWTF